MRIIYSSIDQKQTSLFSEFLKNKGIENQFEAIKGSDWGSSDYGTTTCHIWVIDEDHLDEALYWRDEFLKKPDDPEFKVSESKLKILQDKAQQKIKDFSPKNVNLTSEEPAIYSGMGFITLYILISCIMLFLYASMTTPDVKSLPQDIPYAPVLTPTINKLLMYDYPAAYDYIDEIINKFGISKIQDLKELPPDGMTLLKKYQETPYWQGLYDKIVAKIQDPSTGWNFTAPLFERIKEGEIWRLFTPALMHGSFFHLVFNMILFVILGKQMESKMGSPKYLIFILLAALLTNSSQYLMTGTGFLGISGVVCAMIGFIFVRQRIAAWEGYQFSSVSLSSVFIFIMLMFFLQIISFIIEIYYHTEISPGIANTAHLSGLVFGMLIGFLDAFKVKNG